ncbi:MAG: GAF domain-containing protein [Acidobacteriaceae bacterium]|nr:GAF domain-containing protein [Acidobacteriaceae bacterium]
MKLRDLLTDAEFVTRPPLSRDPDRELIALRRLASLFTERLDLVLKGLVDIAVDFCGADSAGVSLEDLEDQQNPRFRWIAVAGSFERYLNGTTPRHYSPCGTCLDTGRPQHYTLAQPYYDFLGIVAEPILDGMLIPWENESVRGTIWAVSHRSPDVFNLSDYELLKGLASFVSMAVQNQAHQAALRIQEQSAEGSAKANELAHAINNPLQCVTNSLFLARQGGSDAAGHLDQAARDLERLSDIVAMLLRVQRN